MSAHVHMDARGGRGGPVACPRRAAETLRALPACRRAPFSGSRSPCRDRERVGCVEPSSPLLTGDMARVFVRLQHLLGPGTPVASRYARQGFPALAIQDTDGTIDSETGIVIKSEGWLRTRHSASLSTSNDVTGRRKTSTIARKPLKEVVRTSDCLPERFAGNDHA